MYQILTKNNISKVGLAGLPESLYTVSDSCAAPSGILVRSANLIEETFNPELLCIARAGAGVNNIPVDRCAEEGIVCSTLRVQTPMRSRSWCCAHSSLLPVKSARQ